MQAGSVRGTPDVIGVINGVPFAWELKRSKFINADPLQRWELRRFKKAGGLARTVTPANFEECFQELEAISKWQRQPLLLRSKRPPY